MYKKKSVNGYGPLFEENIETLQLDLLSLVTDYSPITERKPEKKTRTTEKVFGFQYYGLVDKNKNIESFISTSSNIEAVKTITNFIDNKDQLIKMLYIHGGSGLGKSHLIHAVSNILLKNKQAFYLTSAILLNHFSDSLHIFNQYKFILIEDVQDIELGEMGEKVLCHLMDLSQKGFCKLIITGNKYNLDNSRYSQKLSGALNVEIKSMDRDLVEKYIDLKSNEINFQISDEQKKIIINRSMQNAHAIDGTLLKFKNLKELQLENLCFLNDDNQTSLIDYEKEVIDNLIDAVALEFNISREDMFSSKRDKDFIFPRHVAMFLLKDRLGLSLNQIGKIFNKDHTTVIYAVEKTKKRLKTDSNFNIQIKNINRL